MGMQEAQVAEVQPAGMKNGGKRRVGDGTPGPGRPKGVGNKLTENIREAIEIAAKTCHPYGLAGWLVDRANGGIQDRQIFAGMVGRVVPLQVNQSVQGGISISLNWLGNRAIGTVTAQPKVIDAQTVELIEQSDGRHWTTDATTAAGGGVAGGQDGQSGIQGAEAVSGYPGLDQPAIASPEPVQAPSRARAAPPLTPHPPVEPGPGGQPELGPPHPSRNFKK